MKEITRYTYLNLEIRPDRKLLAECTAFGIYFDFDSEKFVQTQNTGKLRNAETEKFLMKYLSE